MALILPSTSNRVPDGRSPLTSLTFRSCAGYVLTTESAPGGGNVLRSEQAATSINRNTHASLRIIAPHEDLRGDYTSSGARGKRNPGEPHQSGLLRRFASRNEGSSLDPWSVLALAAELQRPEHAVVQLLRLDLVPAGMQAE